MNYKLRGDLLEGKKFNMLTVIDWDFFQNKWRCLCDCSKETFANSYSLKSGHKKSCGCRRKLACITRPSILKDLKGIRCGKLLVISWDKEKQKWLCRCDCKKEKYFTSVSLKKEEVKSCGCFRKSKQIEDSKQLVGEKYLYLKCIGYEIIDGLSKLKCKCKCGTIKLIDKNHWEKTKSCGCLIQERTGDKCIQAVLTNEQAALIKKLYRGKSGFNMKVLGEMFGVDLRIVSGIVRGETYRDA